MVEIIKNIFPLSWKRNLLFNWKNIIKIKYKEMLKLILLEQNLKKFKNRTKNWFENMSVYVFVGLIGLLHVLNVSTQCKQFLLSWNCQKLNHSHYQKPFNFFLFFNVYQRQETSSRDSWSSNAEHCLLFKI